MKSLFDKSLILIIIVVIAIIVIAEHSNDSIEIKATNNTELSEKNYQKAINLLKQNQWDEATTALIFLHDNNYKDAKTLYNYSQAKCSYQESDYSMADFYMKDIPSTYVGPFKEDILKFKQECSQKNEIAKKEEEEANKITPGCHKVYIGMTKSEAEISMGKPYDINRTVGSYGTHEQWCYNGGVYLYFDNGTLTSWQD